MRCYRCHVRWLLLALSLVSLVARADEGWTELKTKNGVVYESRAVSGSKWLEYRATTQVSLTPEQAFKAIWTGITEQPPTVKRRQVLRHSDDEYVVYDQVATPVVSPLSSSHCT